MTDNKNHQTQSQCYIHRKHLKFPDPVSCTRYARARQSRLDGTHCPAWLRLLSGCAQNSRTRLTAILRRSCPSHAGIPTSASLRRQHHERLLRVYTEGEPASTHNPEARARVQRVTFMRLMNARPFSTARNARPVRRWPLCVNSSPTSSFQEALARCRARLLALGFLHGVALLRPEVSPARPGYRTAPLERELPQLSPPLICERRLVQKAMNSLWRARFDTKFCTPSARALRY